jgi:hypothetical protein
VAVDPRFPIRFTEAVAHPVASIEHWYQGTSCLILVYNHRCVNVHMMNALKIFLYQFNCCLMNRRVLWGVAGCTLFISKDKTTLFYRIQTVQWVEIMWYQPSQALLVPYLKSERNLSTESAFLCPDKSPVFALCLSNHAFAYSSVIPSCRSEGRNFANIGARKSMLESM